MKRQKYACGWRLPWLAAMLGLAVLLAAAGYKWREQPDFSSNPYVFYERGITARIGAYAPYAFMDKGGTLDGYVMDLTYAISRVMGARVVLLSRRLDNPAELTTKHDADVVLCMVKTPATSREYTFTSPYATHTFSIFARKGAALPAGRRLAQGEDWVLNRDGVYYELHGAESACPTTGTAEDALHELAQGRRQYTVMETYIGKKIIEEQSLENVTLLKETDLSVEYAFAVRKGNAAVYDIFSQGLEYLHTSGQFDKIQHKWLEKRFLLTERGLETLLWYVGAVVLLAALAGAAAFVWFRTLREQVRRRTAELEQEMAERHRAETRLLQSQAQLVQADKMAAVGTLASGIAHEINNPNGLLLLNLGFLRDALRDIRPLLDEKFAAEGEFFVGGMPWSRLRTMMDTVLDDALQASGHIRDIVDDLKEFVRKDDGTEHEVFQLNDVMEHSLRFVRSIIKESTASCRILSGAHLPCVKGSPRKMGQVLVNLIINACQALERPEQALTLETGCADNGHAVFFRITDEGCGIATENLPYICDPFFTTKRGRGGTGLGLSISAAIVESHGGTLTFTSEPGRGTTATLTLPAVSEELSHA